MYKYIGAVGRKFKVVRLKSSNFQGGCGKSVESICDVALYELCNRPKFCCSLCVFDSYIATAECCADWSHIVADLDSIVDRIFF